LGVEGVHGKLCSIKLRREPLYRKIPQRCHWQRSETLQAQAVKGVNYLYCGGIFEEYLSQAKVLCKRLQAVCHRSDWPNRLSIPSPI
jgi:hypothetical protein